MAVIKSVFWGWLFIIMQCISSNSTYLDFSGICEGLEIDLCPPVSLLIENILLKLRIMPNDVCPARTKDEQ
jgi:hypothetical protein